MRNKLIRMGVLAVGLIGLLGTATPAQATTQATATFTGVARTSPIGYPCTPAGTTTNCPPTMPTFGYRFASTLCVGEKTDINKPTKHGTDAHGPDCSIVATGNAAGYCGLSSSNDGTASITYFGPLGTTKVLTVNFLFTSTGTVIIIKGSGEKTPGGLPGTLAGIVQATPVPSAPGGPSCTNGTQVDFLVTGEVSYLEVT